MALDFSILSQVPSFGQSFLAGQQAARDEADRNMLRQQQMEQMRYQRENMDAQRQERLAIAKERQARDARAAQRQQFLTGAAEALAQGGEKLNRPTLMKVLQAGVKADEPSLIQFAREGLKALDEEELYQRERQRLGIGGARQPSPAPSIMRQPAAAPAAPTNMLAGTPFDIGVGAPAPANALAAPPAAAPAGVTREMAQQMILSPLERISKQGQALATTLQAPEKPMVVGGNLVSPTGQVLFTAQRQPQLLTPEEEEQKKRIALAGRAPVQPREPREPSAPVAVVDETTGKVKYVTREEAIGKTPAAQIEGLTPKERQKREALFPKAKQAVATVETNMGELIKDLETLASHPGLTGITGVVYGRTPSLTPEAREAQALYDKIVARGGFQELQNMRAASPTGGALGNVSNQEGQQLKQSFAEIGREQATGSVRKALLRAAENARLFKQRAREAFEDTYEYRQGGGQAPAPAPAPGGGGFPTPPQAAIDALKAGRGTDAQFDAVFGPGAAARARGR